MRANEPKLAEQYWGAGVETGAAQRTLFFDVARIIATKRPKANQLQNLKNLLSQDNGNTFSGIVQALRDELGYNMHYEVIAGKAGQVQAPEAAYTARVRAPLGFPRQRSRFPAGQLEGGDWTGQSRHIACSSSTRSATSHEP